MDMTYDVAKVLFAQYPMMVQDWIQSVATAYAQSWELPAILKNVGVVADTVLLFQSLRVDCVLAMFDFIARGHATLRTADEAEIAESVKARWVRRLFQLFALDTFALLGLPLALLAHNDYNDADTGHF